MDSMGIVWHGHYVKFFEDGRESFGKEHDLGYMDIYNNGYHAPIVKVECNYKKTVNYDETLIIETEFVKSKAAKIIFNFKILNKRTKEIVAEGESIQVFTLPNGELMLTDPPFYAEWKKRKGVFI